MKKNAFTLAEVLITLGIIGVVAALTMPQLLHKHRNFVLEQQFKKAYSTLAQTLLRLSVDEPDFYDDITGLRNPAANSILKPALMKYMNVAKDYNASGYIPNLQAIYTTYNGNLPVADSTWGRLGQFSLADGSFIFTDCVTMCTPSVIIVDIHGVKKGPNRSGYDLFTFTIGSKMELLPFNHLYNTNPASGYYGFSNAEKVLSESDYFKNLP